MIDNTPVVVLEIMGDRFKGGILPNARDFFKLPLKSSQLNIWRCDSLSKKSKVWRLDDLPEHSSVPEVKLQARTCCCSSFALSLKLSVAVGLVVIQTALVGHPTAT